MGALPVHIAVLTIADSAANADRATANAISEKLTGAGHQIVDEEIVRDDEAAIHDQLVRWISRDDIDVVFVAAPLESESVSPALAPLVMQTLPGFTDLFRWLTFQEVGATAMQSTAEAAQCQGTFVFALPANPGAVRAAMDKLILPQLDVTTKPKNLVTQMPRLKDAAKRLAPLPSIVTPAPPVMPVTLRPDTEPEAVPQHVEKERTQGGHGLPPKLPAGRAKPITSNTIKRKTDDPPTKPIDLAKLEKQIALSTQNDSETKQIDLQAKTKVVDMSAHQAKTRVVDSGRVLPRVPPGADDSAGDDDTDSLTFTTPPRSNQATQALPSSMRAPGPIGVVKPPPQTPPRGAVSTPMFSTPIARTTPATPRQAVATPPPTPVVRAESRPAPARPPATPKSSPHTPPIQLTRDMAITPVKPTPVVSPRPQLRPPTAPPPTVDSGWGSASDEAPTTHSPHRDEAPTIRKPESIPPPTPVSAIDDEQRTSRAGAAGRPTPSPNAAEMWARTMTGSITDTPQPTTEQQVTTGAIVEEQPAEVAEVAEVIEERPAPISNLFAQPAAKPKPVAPPVDPLAAVALRPVGDGDLPQGDFHYPLKKSGAGIVLKILLGLGVLAAGFFAFIHFFPQDDQPAQTASVTPPPAPAPTPPPPPAPPVPVATPVDAPVQIEIDAAPVELEPPPQPPPVETKQKPSRSGKSKTKPAGEGSAADSETSESKPKSNPEVASGGGGDCDEVSCVMTKYDRPCCERYKPSDGFTPKNVVPDELDRTMVKAGVEKIKPKVVACGEQSGTKGTVRLAVTVDGDGTVKSVSVTESPDSALGECVATAMRKAKFGKSINGGEFNYPFVF